MQWAASYIGSNFALIAVVVLVVAALVVIAIFSRNWKVAVAALIVTAAGLGYQHLDKMIYQRFVAEQAANEIAMLKGRLKTLSDANEAHAKRAAADADEIETLKTETPKNDKPAIDAETAKRIGKIR